MEQTGSERVGYYADDSYKTFVRPSWDEYFMLQAELAKLRSNCVARQVGAAIVLNNRQIATGYNGTPPGIKNCYEGGCTRCQDRVRNKIKSGDALNRCLCNHAEANAIMHCAILGIGNGTKGATLYTTLVPCMECTKMAVTVGIKRFVYLETYPETDTNLLKDAGVEMIRMDRDKINVWAKRLLRGYEMDPNDSKCCGDRDSCSNDGDDGSGNCGCNKDDNDIDSIDTNNYTNRDNTGSV